MRWEEKLPKGWLMKRGTTFCPVFFQRHGCLILRIYYLNKGIFYPSSLIMKYFVLFSVSTANIWNQIDLLDRIDVPLWWGSVKWQAIHPPGFWWSHLRLAVSLLPCCREGLGQGLWVSLLWCGTLVLSLPGLGYWFCQQGLDSQGSHMWFQASGKGSGGRGSLSDSGQKIIWPDPSSKKPCSPPKQSMI